jgi:hypothetical protein
MYNVKKPSLQFVPDDDLDLWGKFLFGYKKTCTFLLATQKIELPFYPSILFYIPF